MKKLLIAKFVCLLSLVMALPAAATTLEEFTKMSHDDRVAVCAKFVASEDIGECASIKSSPEMIENKKAQNEAIQSCLSEGKGTPQDVAACANGKLRGQAGPSFSGDDYEKAVLVCSNNYQASDTNKIAACVASVLGKTH
ncbi:hypothetical protein ACFSJ3_11265 [Corallincola platygyrae]|uniref:Uncharacterized protein n=1 Tax=Corallincola platygyrae TaxID=1193278 RepID=A0ABW4XQ44_9GAMM